MERFEYDSMEEMNRSLEVLERRWESSQTLEVPFWLWPLGEAEIADLVEDLFNGVLTDVHPCDLPEIGDLEDDDFDLGTGRWCF